MKHYCKNGDEIRVGGVYVFHNYEGEKAIACEEVSNNHLQCGRNYYTVDLVTRELPRDSDGYYLWDGGDCPVPDDWVIMGEYRNGTGATDPARLFKWNELERFRVVSTGEDWCKVGSEVYVKGDGRVVRTIVRISEDYGVRLNDSRWVCRTELEPRSKLGWETVPEVPYTGEGLEFNNEASDMEKPRAAEAFLHQAAELMTERGKTYDQASGERSMGKTIIAFNAVTGRDLTEPEGWLLMSLVKRVRQYSTPSYHKDSAEDAVAYAALEAESLEAKC